MGLQIRLNGSLGAPQPSFNFTLGPKAELFWAKFSTE